jgi:LmbE family N-acetylglucosaminyl deacetylase
MERTLVNVAPHPDDEALGAPVTLLFLRRAGWRVVNAVVSLGRPDDRSRRRQEAEEAARRADFDLVFPEQPFGLSAVDDLARSEDLIAKWLHSLFQSARPAIVLSPSPQDGHHGHEVVGRSVRRAVAELTFSVVWWVWGLWADLPFPTLYVPFDHDLLVEARYILHAYGGEIARNDYDKLLEARAVANAVLGSERVFGFGTARASAAAYAEVLTELWHTETSWRLGETRILHPDGPVVDGSRTAWDVTWWVNGPSPQERLRVQSDSIPAFKTSDGFDHTDAGEIPGTEKER